MKTTKDMLRARFALQELSTSDPAARLNMLRHLAAFTLLLTGRRDQDRRGGEPLFAAGFQFAEGEQELHGELVRQDGLERVYLAFDIDDALGDPLGLGIIRREGEHVISYGRCLPWCFANDGRALLVPIARDGSHEGYFAFRRGQPCRYVRGHVPGDFEAGRRRAVARLNRLFSKPELLDPSEHAVSMVIGAEGHRLRVSATPLAA